LSQPDPKFQDLYRIGGFTAVGVFIIVVVSIIGYFIWPYAPGLLSTSEIFAAIQESLIGGVVALDLLLLFGIVAQIPFLVALYASLKPVNEGYALLALIIGLVAISAIIPSRPVAEVAYLSDVHAAATAASIQTQTVAAGEALLTLFHGTAWMVGNILLLIAGLTFSLLMTGSPVYSRTTHNVGIITHVFGAGFLIPVIGPVLMLIATFGSLAWLLLCAQTLFHLSRDAVPIMEGDPAWTK
jgi:hypothetical protein